MAKLMSNTRSVDLSFLLNIYIQYPFVGTMQHKYTILLSPDTRLNTILVLCALLIF